MPPTPRKPQRAPLGLVVSGCPVAELDSCSPRWPQPVQWKPLATQPSSTVLVAYCRIVEKKDVRPSLKTEPFRRSYWRHNDDDFNSRDRLAGGEIPSRCVCDHLRATNA